MPEWCDKNVVLDKYQQSDTGSITNDFDYEQSSLSNDIDIEMTPDEFIKAAKIWMSGQNNANGQLILQRCQNGAMKI